MYSPLCICVYTRVNGQKHNVEKLMIARDHLTEHRRMPGSSDQLCAPQMVLGGFPGGLPPWLVDPGIQS